VTGQSIFLDTPEANFAALELAKRHGMTPTFETARMYTREPPKSRLDRCFGVTTFELCEVSVDRHLVAEAPVGRPSMTFAAFALGAFVLAPGSAGEASRAEDLGPTVELKPGQEIAFPVAIVDDRVMLGKPRLSRPGATQPKDGEIAVNVVKHDASPYADLTASEKTPAPVDFVATGLIGNIKIDEVKLCGRLNAATSAHIYSGSWRISLNRFSVGHGGEPCQ
jgi:hypothetical protein